MRDGITIEASGRDRVRPGAIVANRNSRQKDVLLTRPIEWSEQTRLFNR